MSDDVNYFVLFQIPAFLYFEAISAKFARAVSFSTSS
jgi:hypothetical protein